MGNVIKLARKRKTLATRNGDDRYNPRGLTDLWLEMLERDSKHTRKSYEFALTSWLSYCRDQGVHPFEARRADVDDWLMTLGEISPSTWNARQSAVRSWYGYMRTNKATENDPVGAIGRKEAKRETSNTAFMSPEEIGQLLDYANRYADEVGTETAGRNASELNLMLATGIRSAPVLDGTLDQLYRKGGHHVFGLRNKGGTILEVVIPPLVSVRLDRYLELRAQRYGLPVNELEGRIFVSAPYRGKGGDKAIQHKDLIEMVRRYARKAGLESFERLTSHSTRHSVITALLDAGVPLHEVQYLVGHRDPRTTELYHHGKRKLDNSPAYRMAGLMSHHSNYQYEQEDR
ncbi:tyrosine-type recombinase/integrase [Saccharopolyspora hattusasensis]|uniref:tyrosine-type recombinase/integrase n=1 Tax=Saccharopolyspora hattusasensis TaxID=1128679 RepID=UPI003D95EC04